MNEAETRAELIDPALLKAGWGEVPGSRVQREFSITAGRIQSGGVRGRKLIADYVLLYRNVRLAIIEAKGAALPVGEGVAQAKEYAEKLSLRFTYATNGKEIYEIDMETGREELVDSYPGPEELWARIHEGSNNWLEAFTNVPFEDRSGSWQLRYYQEIAINNALEAIAEGKDRILLTLATGTGKTAIAFQIAWKLFQTRWNLQRDGGRRPNILFLADRNILADQAFNAFSSFPEDALVRIKPGEIRKKGKVPTNGSIFFTIFQTFMSGRDEEGKLQPYFGEYPRDFFDFIIIDECHRGGANDESNWRAIMEYFSPAVQLGLTATPKRDDNVDTYRYFGEPVYIYSLKEGINDGFLTPFKVKRIRTTIDDYTYTSDDTVVEGEIEEGKRYEEQDFNRSIEIVEREAKRVVIYLDDANQKEKAIIFCANQPHAALIRDLVNQYKSSKDTNYCVRVTANDGEIGEQFLREFQDNEKTIPTILTTSQKLSTGVDARNIRNIVLLRPINSMIEFKQIIGRGTRLFDGKDYFTIYDYVDACHHFSDPEWDGEPGDPEPCKRCGQDPCICEYVPPKPCPVCGMRPCICETIISDPCLQCGQSPCICGKRKMVKVKLSDDKAREIDHMIATSFWSADGKPISAEEFMQSLFGELPRFFSSEEDLRKLWSDPMTRKVLLQQLDDAGYGKESLRTLQQLIRAEDSDLFDVLEYVANAASPLTRQQRADAASKVIFAILDDKQREFIEFVLTKYVETGVEELDRENLPKLLTRKYQSFEEAEDELGDLDQVAEEFVKFQKYLYDGRVAKYA